MPELSLSEPARAVVEAVNPLTVVDMRLVTALVDGSPVTAETVLGELLSLGVASSSTWPGWYVVHPVQESEEPMALVGEERSRARCDWYVAAAVDADRAVHPFGRRLSPAYDRAGTSRFGGATQGLWWFDAHRSSVMIEQQGAVERGWWLAAWTLSESLAGLTRAVGHHQAQLTSQDLGLVALSGLWRQENAAVTGPADEGLYLVRAAMTTARMAAAHSLLGDHLQARRDADQAVELARRAGDVGTLGAAFRCRGRVVLASGVVDALADVVADLRKALALDGNTGDTRALACSRRLLGEILAVQGLHVDAEEQLGQASELMDAVGDHVGAARVQVQLAKLFTDTGHAELALPVLRDAVEVVAHSGTPGQIGGTFLALGDATRAIGALDAARHHYRTAAGYLRIARRDTDVARAEAAETDLAG